MGEVFSAIAPVAVVAAGGYALGRRFELDAKTLSSLNIYLFMPALVFRSLTQRAVEWSVFGRYAVATVLMLAGAAILLGGIARLKDLQGPLRSAFMMTMFVNLGNFGLPISKFAFGEEGLALAVVLWICGRTAQNTLGIYIAHRGRRSVGGAFMQVFYFPTIYALALAVLVHRMQWSLPEVVAGPLTLVADAAIPLQLVILGIQVAESKLETGRELFLAGVVRLCGGPLLAVAVAMLAGLEGLPAHVFIVQMSGPVALGMAVFGVQFDVEPGFIASVVAWTFLFGLITVGVVLFVVFQVSS